MDQRVDNERRSDTVPDRQTTSAVGAAKHRSWSDAFRERRGLVIAIAVVSVGGMGLALLGQAHWLYVVAPGILLVFAAVGANAWVLLIEINR